MSTHCQLFSLGVLYGTRGTPIGIIVAVERDAFPCPALAHAERTVSVREDEDARRRSDARVRGDAFMPAYEGIA